MSRFYSPWMNGVLGGKRFSGFDGSGGTFFCRSIIIPESDKGDNDFNILPRSPYSPEHPFEDNFQVPSGVFYRVQLAAFSQEIKHDHFGGISPITTQAVDSQKITRYFAGKFAAYTEAESALDKVRSAGFKDAFIVGYYNGQRMSVERIREFEKEHHLR